MIQKIPPPCGSGTGNVGCAWFCVICRSFAIHIWVRKAKGNRCLCPHGEARFALSSLCAFQCCQIRLRMGTIFCCLSCKEACRGQALQCCRISRIQETGALDLRFADIRQGFSACLTHLSSYYPERLPRRSLCCAHFMPFTNSLLIPFWGLTFNS